MKKTKHYPHVYFSPEHLTKIGADFRPRAESPKQLKLGLSLVVNLPSERWEHQDEAEFFSDIRKDGASYSFGILGQPYSMIVDCNAREASVVVSARTRAEIEGVFQVVESLALEARRPVLPLEEDSDSNSPVIFIGHGHNPQWRDLKDHLHEQHGLTIQAYEIGARAGHAIRDVLEEMLTSSSIAFLVMTGEDETADGRQRARQNVIHETGLFQGKLGFARAIVLLEAGVEEFSNINGIQQIRFAKGAIRETFGDVLATVRREFPVDVA